MRSSRLRIRIFEEDERRILSILQNTSATSRSEAIRDSLETMDIMWEVKESGGSITLRNDHLMLEHEVFIGTHSISHNRSHLTEGCIEVRFQPRDLRRLDDLVRSGAGMNRSHVVREALSTHAHIASHMSEGWKLFELHSNGKRVICRIPSFRHLTEDKPLRPGERSTKTGNLLRLLVNRDYQGDGEWAFVVCKELRNDIDLLSINIGSDRKSTIDQCVRVGLRKIMNDTSSAPLHRVLHWSMPNPDFELGEGG